MKKLFATLALAAAALPALAASAPTMRVNVPFDFVVGSRTLPAGTYEVTEGAAPNTVQLRNLEHRTSAVAMVTPGAGRVSTSAGLAFREIAGARYLETVSDPSGAKKIRQRQPGNPQALAFVRAAQFGR